MSHSNHTSEGNQRINYKFRVALAFVFVISIACLLRVIIGNQECKHCSICAKCETCEEQKIENIAQQQLWGAEAGEGCCGGCEEEGEGEKKECCMDKKDKCEDEHDGAEAKEEQHEEKADEHKTEAEHK